MISTWIPRPGGDAKPITARSIVPSRRPVSKSDDGASRCDGDAGVLVVKLRQRAGDDVRRARRHHPEGDAAAQHVAQFVGQYADLGYCRQRRPRQRRGAGLQSRGAPAVCPQTRCWCRPETRTGGSAPRADRLRTVILCS
jgi:hypothetical protein